MLELEGVRFARAGGSAVLRGADLRLEAGERLALTGRNGAGKTTLLWIALDLLRPAAGTVRLFGRRCAREADFAPLRLRCGLLFQDPDDQLFCPTVLEDAAFGPLNQGHPPAEAEARARRALNVVGLAGFADRVTHRLSGGEKRLAALAGVLAMEPELLLLDEPTAGLDETATDRVLAALGALDAAMVVVCHDAAARAALAPRARVLEDGVLRAPA